MSASAGLRRWGALLVLVVVVGASVAWFGLRWRRAAQNIAQVEHETHQITQDTIMICNQLNLQLCDTTRTGAAGLVENNNWLCELKIQQLFATCVGSRGGDLVVRYARLYYADAPASPEALEKRAVDKVALRREMQAALDVAVAELSKQLGSD